MSDQENQQVHSSFEESIKFYNPRMNRSLIHYKDLFKTYEFFLNYRDILGEELHDKIMFSLGREMEEVQRDIKDYANNG